MRSSWKPSHIDLTWYKHRTDFLGKKYKTLITYPRCVKFSSIPFNFLGKQLIIHNGKTTKPLLINSSMINHKIGEFVLTKKLAVFIKKKKKK